MKNIGGTCETDKVSKEIKENDIVKVALVNDKVIGFLHFKPIGDLVDCYHILVKEDYQKNGVATKLMESALVEVKNRSLKTLIAHAVEHEGKVNAKKLLEKFGFKEIYKVKNYWRSLYPGEYCKQCDSYECNCGVVVYLRNL